MHARTNPIRWICEPARGLALWGALAIISLLAAVSAALQPDRSNDFALVRVWLHYWTSTWTSPYPAQWLKVDYPPHAFVLLWPLDWLPGDGVFAFLALNLAATAWLAWLLARWAAEETGTLTSSRHLLVFACMLLAWGPMRAGLWHGQTVMAAAIAGVYAVRLATRAPWLAGIALALAATKPTLGAGFGLILLLRGGHRAFLIGVCTTLGLTVVFDVTVGNTPLASIAEFAGSLVRMYTGESYVRSATTIRAALVDLAGGHWFAHVVYASLGAGTCIALMRTAWPRRHHPGAQLLIASGCLLWVLLALPNQRYYLILLAPMVWMLAWTPQVFARAGATWPAWTALGIIVFLVTDAPVTLRRTAEYFGDSWPFSLEWLWIASYLSAGVLVLICFVIVLRALRRITSLR